MHCTLLSVESWLHNDSSHTFLNCRHLAVECGVLPQANGSARVTLFNGNTEIIAAVKVELGTPETARPNEGGIECNVECWATGSSGMGGRSPAEVNAELSAALRR